MKEVPSEIKRHANLKNFTFSTRGVIDSLLAIRTKEGKYFVINNYFYRKDLDNEISKQREKFKIEEIKIPLSKMIVFTSIKDGTEYHLLISKKNKARLYNLLVNYEKGLSLVSREERYRNMYIVYEALCKNQKIELRAIRHSLSHPKLNDKKIVKVLHKLFGDEVINLNIYKHAKTFKLWEKILKHDTFLLLKKKLVYTARNSIKTKKFGSYLLI